MDTTTTAESIKFNCYCGQKFNAAHDWQGQRVTCPSCGESISVPRLQTQDTPDNSEEIQEPAIPLELPITEEDRKKDWSATIFSLAFTIGILGIVFVLVHASKAKPQSPAAQSKQATELVTSWLKASRDAKPTFQFWTDHNKEDKLFAVTDWKILSVDFSVPENPWVKARIHSSNRAGIPLVNHWTISLNRSANGAFTIGSVYPVD